VLVERVVMEVVEELDTRNSRPLLQHTHIMYFIMKIQ
jgi:hypothetical protein